MDAVGFVFVANGEARKLQPWVEVLLSWPHM